MPRDEDEDLSAPMDLGPNRPAPGRGKPPTARPVGKPAQPAQPAAAPAAASWGACGVVHQFGELTVIAGTSGVIRYVSSGVNYTPPPIQARWKAVPTEHGRYEMAWEGNPSTARSLRDLRSDLEKAARTRQLDDPEHPLLRELDEVASALLGTATQLRQEGWSLGLIQPDSVLIRGKAGRREVVLVDLGFAWKGSYGDPPWEDAPGRPNWLDPLASNRWLWDHDAVRQQFAAPENGVFPATSAVSDVRTLGRLFAWLLSGQTSKDVPMVGGEEGPPPVWEVLSAAAAGRIPTPEALAGRLRKAPLSDYFSAPSPEIVDAPKKKSKLPLVLASLFVLMLAGGGAAWYFLIREKPKDVVTNNEPEKKEEPKKEEAKKPDDPPKKPIEPPPDHSFEDLLKDFDEAHGEKSVPGMFVILGRLVPLADTDERKKEVDPRRAKALDAWIVEVNAAVKDGADPSKRLEVASRLDTLREQLETLSTKNPATDPAQQDKETQCLDYVATFLRQLGPPQ
jgi:hypothetical protein